MAYMWMNIARANGSDVSKQIEMLTRGMTRSEVSQAQELTRQYIQEHPNVY